MTAIGSSVFRNSPYWLNFLYAGQLYSFDWEFTVLKTNGTFIFQLTTSATKFTHVLSNVIAVEGGGPLTIELIEAPATVVGGTVRPIYNMDRRKTKAAGSVVKSGVTSYTGGTVISTDFLPTGGGPTGVGALPAGIAEKLLKVNTIYLIKLTNHSASTDSTVITNALFYESGN